MQWPSFGWPKQQSAWPTQSWYLQYWTASLEVYHHAEGCIDWVVDAYPEVCIKNVERDRRSTIASGSLTSRIRSGAQKVDQQMKKSMRSGTFKAPLTQFLMQEWSGKEYICQPIREADTLCYCRRQVFQTEGWWERVRGSASWAALSCTQEEADARMLLNAAHAADHAIPGVVIRSPDSDVAVIALSDTHPIDTQLKNPLPHKNPPPHKIPRLNCHWMWAWTREVQCLPWMSCLVWVWLYQRIHRKGQGFRLQITKSWGLI